MPKQRSPNRDKAFEIYKEHKGNITLREIAKILETPEKTISGWKVKDKWDSKLNGVLQTKIRSTPKEKKAASNTSKENIKIENSTSLIVDELTERQRLFAEEFVRVPIAYKAAIKAGYSPNCSFMEGSRLMRNDKVKRYIEYLKQLKRESLLIGEEDLVDVHMRIAFSDITDFVEFGRERTPVLIKGMPVVKKNPVTGENEPVTKLVNTVRLKESFEVDGSLISEVSNGKDGVKIKLYDKQKSLDWLTNYFTLNPMDKHKMDFDNAKLEMAKKKLELEKLKVKSDENIKDREGINDFIKATTMNEEEIKELFKDDADEQEE